MISTSSGTRSALSLPGAPIVVESRIVGDSAVLTVANEGPGISREDLDRLFEPYHRGTNAANRHGSMGLGLFIAREVITAHGGTIEVESQPEAMTRFTVRMPRIAHVPATPV